MNNINDMDRIFREKLENFSKEPPAEIWENINSGIAGGKKRALVPLWRVAAGLALLITAGTLYLFIGGKDSLNTGVAHKSNTVLQPSTSNRNNAERENTVISSRDLPETAKADAATHSSESTPVAPGNGSVVIIPVNQGDIIPASTNASVKADQDIIGDHGKDKFGYIASSGPESFNIPGIYSVTLRQDRIPAVTKPEITDEMVISMNTYEQPEAGKKPWLLSAQVSPTFTYRTLSYNDQQTINKFNDTETGRLSYSGGFQVGYKASDRFSLYTGVMYAKAGTQITNIYSGVEQKNVIEGAGKIQPVRNNMNVYFLSNSTGVIESAKSDWSSSSYSQISTSTDIQYYLTSVDAVLKSDDRLNQYFQFIEVPLLARYKVVDSKIKINLIGGINTDLLIGNRVVLVSDGRKSLIGETRQIRKMNYAGNFGFGFDYDLGTRFILSVEPQFKYYLNSINNSDLIRNRPYSIGMFTGIRYSF